MVTNAEYDMLLNKYNRLVAESNDLREQQKNMRAGMQKREAEIKHNYDLMSKLCEEILSKDRSEMVVGSEYSWKKLPMDALIERAAESYRKYNADRKATLQAIADKAEERANKIKDLEDQIAQMETMSKESGASVSAKEAAEAVQKKKDMEHAMSLANANIRDAVENERVEIITEENEDFTVNTIKAAVDSLDIALSTPVTESSIPISESRTKVNAIKKAKEKQEIVSKTVLTDIGQYEKQMNDACYSVIEVIGRTGKSRITEIVALAEKDLKDKGLPSSTSRVKAALVSLERMTLLDGDSPQTALHSHIKIAKLSVVGHIFYKEKYGKVPEISEWDKVVAEHDSLSHGYSILELVEAMQNGGQYAAVSGENHRAPIVVGTDGYKYVPDIIAQVDKGNGKGYKEYIEYENGNHTQPDFNHKLSKMSLATRYINIIAANNDAMDLIINKVKKWLPTVGEGMLKKLKIRITTAKYFVDNTPGTPGSWLFTLDPVTGEVNTPEK